jgi:2-dehydro-3-deoxygluconokinase
MRGFDVVVMGEPLVELHSDEVLSEATTFELSFSGDALTAAAAAAAAGARTALLTIIGDDELSQALLTRLEELGVDTSLIRRSERPNGAYLVGSDITGDREFIYWRTGSAASELSTADVERERAVLEQSKGLVASGIGTALSATSEQAVLLAARVVSEAGGHVTYDPNFRSRLTTAKHARRVLEQVAPYTTLMTPSCPGDARALLQTEDPDEAAARCQALGADIVAVTSGPSAVTVHRGDLRFKVPVPYISAAVDATGAGDVLTGAVTARLVLGDDLETALRVGAAAAALSTTGRGGTGRVVTLSDARHLSGLIGATETSAEPSDDEPWEQEERQWQA